ncbi:MAG: hypothetical protein IPK08_01610 [Bacteroidetes bacterium]|nr:hypothetical protein [Bacteroidota bacterium]
MELTCENAPGVTAQSLSYIIRPHPNNGTFEDENTSAENNYNLESIVTAASNAAVTSTLAQRNGIHQILACMVSTLQEFKPARQR